MVKFPSNLDHVRPNSLPSGHQGRSKSLPSGHHVRSKTLPWGHHVRPIPYPGDRPHDQIPSRCIKLHRQLQRKGHIKIELCVRLSALRLVDVSHVHKIAKVSCRLILPQMVFMSAAKNGRFTVAGSRYRQNLTYENFTLLFGRVRKKIAPNSVPHVPHAQHDYFSSLNQSNHWFMALSMPLPSSFLN